MNGGQVATRGFLVQTLIALLDTLNSLDKIKTLRLEPSTDDDKTDFVLEYNDGRKKAVQVKSSQNQIGLPAVKKWASKLKADFVADEYELVLIGPVSGDLTKLDSVEGVKLPIPRSLDVKSMFEQASHRLDLYFHWNQMSSGSPVFRELVVDGLIGRLSAYSTAGTPLVGSELAKLFEGWANEVKQQVSHEIEKRFGNGTLTDVDAIKEYSAQFDRAALQDSLRGCGSYKKFSDALSELVELLNTGKMRGQVVTKRRADFANPEWKDILDVVYHEVRGLREWYTELVRSNQIDEATCSCNFHKQSVYAEFEAKKRRIIDRLNELLCDAKLPTIRGVS